MNVRRFLFRLLGMKGYLRWVSRIFFWSYRRGRLRDEPEYYAHYYIRRFIRPGDHVLDIGANLGYYARHFAEWVGRTGRVMCVEPVPIYREILQENLRGFAWVELFPYALGTQNKSAITMGVPAGHTHFRHGMTKVLDQRTATKQEATFEVEMRKASELFSGLQRLDYLKCDIEGYEIPVIPELISIIEQHLPIIQIETSGEQRDQIHDLLKPKGYRAHRIEQDRLLPVKKGETMPFGDLIFLPPHRMPIQT